MRAVVYDPDAPTKLRFDDVAEPEPADDEVVIDVGAIALNFGEIHWIANARLPGEVPGWDAAGVVSGCFSNDRISTMAKTPGMIRNSRSWIRESRCEPVHITLRFPDRANSAAGGDMIGEHRGIVTDAGQEGGV